MGGLLLWHSPSWDVGLVAAVWRLVHLPDLSWGTQEESEGRQGHLRPHPAHCSSQSLSMLGILCALTSTEGLPGKIHMSGSLPQAPLPA